MLPLFDDCTGEFKFILAPQSLAEDDFTNNPESRALGVALADFNNDHLLDIFVYFDGLDRVWLQNPTPKADQSDRFIRDRALSDSLDNTIDFEDIGASRSVSAILQDFNHDGFVDIYVANRKQSNTFWINQRFNSDDPTFRNTKQGFGSDNTNSISCADLDNDGSLDLYVSNEATDSLWYNNRDKSFKTCNEITSSTPTTKAITRNFTTDDDDPATLNGRVDIYLAKRVIDAFLFWDPIEHFGSEQTIAITASDDAFDTLLIDLISDVTTPSEPSQALEALIFTAKSLNLFTLKFSDDSKSPGQYNFQRLSSISTETIPSLACVRSASYGDLDHDGDLDILLWMKQIEPSKDDPNGLRCPIYPFPYGVLINDSAPP